MNITRYRFFNTLLLQVVAGLMCSVAIASMPQRAPAADDAYLKALEVEANNSAKLTKKAKKSENKTGSAQTKRQPKPSTAVNGEKDVEKLLRNEFEQTLANERPATYTFYSKLPESDKSSVLETYKESKKISTTSKKIFDLYFALTKK